MHNKLFLCLIILSGTVKCRQVPDEVVKVIKPFLALLDAGSATNKDDIRPHVTNDLVVLYRGLYSFGEDAINILLDDVITNSIAYNLNMESLKIIIPDKLVLARGQYEWDEDDDGELDYCGVWIGFLKKQDTGKFKFSEIIYSGDEAWGNDEDICQVDNFPTKAPWYEVGTSSEYSTEEYSPELSEEEPTDSEDEESEYSPQFQ